LSSIDSKLDGLNKEVGELKALVIKNLRGEIDAVANQGTDLTNIPQTLETKINDAAKEKYPDFDQTGNFPLIVGADSFVLYFNKVNIINTNH
jgi:hypothetical protein